MPNSSAMTGDYLSHWTRAPAGAWPDETHYQYLSDVMLGTRELHSSAFATLMRIATQQRLLASADAIRGSTQVVCFTELHPLELASQRVYRAHRNRWDREPYGISLRASWLGNRGARRVIYGDEQTWQTLAPEDRPFYQRRTTTARRASNKIDWSSECEWRHIGDLDLSQLGPREGFLFVPTAEEAAQLQAISRWPVVTLQLIEIDHDTQR